MLEQKFFQFISPVFMKEEYYVHVSTSSVTTYKYDGRIYMVIPPTKGFSNPKFPNLLMESCNFSMYDQINLQRKGFNLCNWCIDLLREAVIIPCLNR